MKDARGSCKTFRNFRDGGRQQDAADLDKAAAGGDVADVAISLRIVLMLEHVECQPQ